MNVPKRYRSLRRTKPDASAAAGPPRPSVPAVPTLPAIKSGGLLASGSTATGNHQQTRSAGPELSTPAHSRSTGPQLTVTIEIFDADHPISLACAPTTTATALIGLAVSAAQRQRGMRISQPVSALRIHELCQNHDISRDLFGCELIDSVIKDWDPKKVNSLRLVPAISSSTQNDSRFSEFVPPVSGWIRVKLKPSKWSKRWAFVEDSFIYISKKPSSKPKDKVLLCNLSYVNFYTLAPYHLAQIGSPSQFCFALKSTKKHAMFENQHAFLHFVACNDRPNIEMWQRSIQSARFLEVSKESQERLEIFSQTQTANSRAGPSNGPLISHEDLKMKPAEHTAVQVPPPLLAIEQSSVNLSNPVKRHKSTLQSSRTVKLKDVPVVYQPKPDVAVTKDSLLDKLMHGENLASTSNIPNPEDSVKRTSYDEPGSRYLDRPSGHNVRRTGSTRRDAGYSAPDSYSRGSSDFDRARINEASARSTNHYSDSHEIVDPTPQHATRLSAEIHSSKKIEDDEDENVPLYKKLQQLDLNVGSKNPFLDPDLLALPGARSSEPAETITNPEPVRTTPTPQLFLPTENLFDSPTQPVHQSQIEAQTTSWNMPLAPQPISPVFQPQHEASYFPQQQQQDDIFGLSAHGNPAVPYSAQGSTMFENGDHVYRRSEEDQGVTRTASRYRHQSNSIRHPQSHVLQQQQQQQAQQAQQPQYYHPQETHYQQASVPQNTFYQPHAYYPDKHPSSPTHIYRAPQEPDGLFDHPMTSSSSPRGIGRSQSTRAGSSTTAAAAAAAVRARAEFAATNDTSGMRRSMTTTRRKVPPPAMQKPLITVRSEAEVAVGRPMFNQGSLLDRMNR
ncbi:hypothetical protein BZA70DRAFT_294716 [Myxozyma melibiosi]|uniref:PH domain-containing protein n=1 Tax=Myxozyma melibiosi TaxID=54550 RepID=A0ABR1F9A9_9ASCO